jgi:Ulp1 family protease
LPLPLAPSAPLAPSSLPELSLPLPLTPLGPGLDAAKLTRSLANLTDSDIVRVASLEKMLNDEGINSYLSLLTLHFTADRAVHLPTFFWTSYARHGYDNVKKWLPECWSPDHTPGILMIPINKYLHWFLISVNFARREISLYDLMTDDSHIATQAFKVMTIHNMSNSSLIIIFRI